MTTQRPPSPPTMAALLAALEEISRGRPDRVLRLRGRLSVDAEGLPVDAAAAPAGETEEDFELLIFRGFSSSVTHPTAFDPDRPALPEGAVITAAELLAGPLNPLQERRLAGPQPVEAFLAPAAWSADNGTGTGTGSGTGTGTGAGEVMER